MSKEILAPKLALLGASTVSGSLTLTQQLNVLYPFLYLQLPLYIFFILIIIAALIGSLAALLTDVMEEEASSFKKVLFAFSIGLTSSFIILPSLVSVPSMGILLLTALGTSFSGTILIYILAQVIKDKNIQSAIKNSISKTILYVFNKAESFIDYFLGNKK